MREYKFPVLFSMAEFMVCHMTVAVLANMFGTTTPYGVSGWAGETIEKFILLIHYVKPVAITESAAQGINLVSNIDISLLMQR